MARPYLLIDADVFAFKAAAGAERIVCWEDDCCFPICNLSDALAAWNQLFIPVLEYFDADLEDCSFCFSTDHNGGFRRQVLPTYKANRDGKARPVALKYLREKLMSGWLPNVYIREGLEADDCLGILSTQKSFMPDRQKIIVSVDKDMKSIPGHFFNFGHPEEGVQYISEADADLWFYKQTLMGDTTDGYTGCPSIGPKTADKILAANPSWEAVAQCYESKGLSEHEAVTQARVARILRASDYDFKNKQVKLWRPRDDYEG